MKSFRLVRAGLGACFAIISLVAAGHASTSVYPLRPDDSQAVYVAPGDAGVAADGVGDDTAALQRAIDQVQARARRGLVFIASGRYRLTRALQVWSGIRLIGYGPTRPVLFLSADTPGYQSGEGKYLVHFVSDRPESPGQPVRDANPGTFYSAMSNIDVEIAAGNPAAVGVRSHYAQHCFLAHMEFFLGSARAGVEEVGNESEDLHFHGGEFGITTHKPSPSWPFLLIDSSFEGQRRAAIETEEGGLTLVRTQVRNTPTVILVRPGRCEELWMKDSRFEAISGPALVISDERSARTQITLENTVCADVPVFAAFRESGRQLVAPAGASRYRVAEFIHGLHVADDGASPRIATTFHAEPLVALPPPVPTDIAALPPMDSWVNLRTLGARGDGETDDTATLRAAIAAHRTLYLPSGRYRVTEPIVLRPDTVLIGFNPITTQILLKDFTPAFQGVNGPTEPPTPPPALRRFRAPRPFTGRGAPVPLFETPRGGTNILTGLGLDTGGANNRAVALKWCAGERSLVNDVRFLGGHGTYDTSGQWLSIYNDNQTADPDPLRRWDSQYWSLWVTDGGGGTFKDIWTPSPFAAAGLFVSETSTPGRVYALSSEHHVRNEVKLRGVSHWLFCALQTEEERGESPAALPLEMDRCSDITVANFFLYRVDTPAPFPTGIRVTASQDLHFRGLHVYSPGKLSFDNTLVDVARGLEFRSREIAALDFDGTASRPPARPSRVEKLAGGFTAIDGLIADGLGGVFFVDPAWSRIYHWSAKAGLALVSDAVPEPVALAIDAAGDLLIVSRHGNVYALKPGASESTMLVLSPEPAQPLRGATVWLPLNRWRDSHDFVAATTRREPLHYISPDRSVFIPAPESFPRLTQPRGGWGAGTIDIARTYALAPAGADGAFYVADEFSQKTWRFAVRADGTLAEPQLFAEEGEVGTVVDADGRVYVGAGQIFVYDVAGREIDMLDVPERPTALALGGVDQRILFVAARSSLYAVKLDQVARP